MENLNNVLKNFGVTCVGVRVAVSHTSSGYAALTQIPIRRELSVSFKPNSSLYLGVN